MEGAEEASDKPFTPSIIKQEPLETREEVEEAPPSGGEEKKEFLAPPPASTLLIRRARVGSTGMPTYVVTSSSNKNDVPQQVRRRPGRPVGSIGSYKRRKSESSEEVRVSSRMSTSIFKHDSSSGGKEEQHANSLFPSPIRIHPLSSGKPPVGGGKGFMYRRKESSMDNIDPFTGKRRYTRRKKLSFLLNKKHFSPEPITNAQEGAAEEDEEDELHLSDNGVWSPLDDFRLLVNILNTGDLLSVFVGVRFSCYFSYKEMEDRWRKLMYGEKASLVAQNAIAALHPDVKARIYFESLFSKDEEQLLKHVKKTSEMNPELSVFESLLENNPHVFNKYRTARSLMSHWLNMKDFHLLPHQNVLEYDPCVSFDWFEESVLGEEWSEEEGPGGEDEAIEMELKGESRQLKKKIRLVDDEIAAWQLLTDQIIDDGMKDKTLPPLPTDFDNKTYALLRGKEVYYGMTSREIIMGRSTREFKVDADLTEEGASNKISRKQALIRLTDMGKFVIINKGRATIFVDRKAVGFRCAARLYDQSVIEVCQITLVFLVNELLIEKFVECDVRREVFGSFKDLECDLAPPPPLPPVSIPHKFLPPPPPPISHNHSIENDIPPPPAVSYVTIASSKPKHQHKRPF